MLLLRIIVLVNSSSHARNGTLVLFFCKFDNLKCLYRRDLSDEEKKDYIDAVKCLQSRPAQNPAIPVARTRFDEFHAQHIQIAEQVHYVVSVGQTKISQAFSHFFLGRISSLAPALCEIV